MHKVTAVLATHWNSHKPYLDLCLESLKRNKMDSNLDLEVIVVSSREEEVGAPPWVVGKYIPVSHDTIAPVAFNLGFKNARQDSDWFLMLNDDTCIPEGVISRLVDSTKGQKMILNSFCNTDVGWLYKKDITFQTPEGKTMQMPRFTTIDKVKGFEEEMLTYPSDPKDIMLRTPFNCFHATLIPAKLWKLLNGLDEAYVSGPDDRDFCLRAAQVGVESWLNISAHIFHFGGTSVAKNPKMEENRKRNAEHFKTKWGYYPN